MIHRVEVHRDPGFGEMKLFWLLLWPPRASPKTRTPPGLLLHFRMLHSQSPIILTFLPAAWKKLLFPALQVSTRGGSMSTVFSWDYGSTHTIPDFRLILLQARAYLSFISQPPCEVSTSHRQLESQTLT